MSDEQDQSQKTEEPTAKKLQEARKKGQVPLSREINNWGMLCAATLLIAAFSDTLFNDLRDILTFFIGSAHQIPYGEAGVNFALAESLKSVLHALALPLFILLIAAFLGPFIQVGAMISAESIKPDLSKISPIKGFSRLFSMRSIVEFTKGILKIVVIGILGTIILAPYFDKFEHLVGLPIPLMLDELKILVIRLMIGVLVVLTVIAVIDLVYQRNEHYKKMRMTKQELKDEYKQTEGDPHVKAKLRQLRSERARQRMMQAVPDADVVITNPTHFAIALKYNPEEMDAPLCLAKGTDEVAQRIKAVAKEHNIEQVENVPLARALYDSVEIEETIPFEHFQAVAEVISFVFQKKGKLN